MPRSVVAALALAMLAARHARLRGRARAGGQERLFCNPWLAAAPRRHALGGGMCAPRCLGAHGWALRLPPASPRSWGHSPIDLTVTFHSCIHSSAELAAPTWKHSQYFFMQWLLRQLHPRRCCPPSVESASICSAARQQGLPSSMRRSGGARMGQPRGAPAGARHESGAAGPASHAVAQPRTFCTNALGLRCLMASRCLRTISLQERGVRWGRSMPGQRTCTAPRGRRRQVASNAWQKRGANRAKCTAAAMGAG